jgi:hypothetical protein
LDEERGKILQKVLRKCLLEACLDMIPSQSEGWLTIPKMNIESDKEGMAILKKILSAAIKNKNITGINFQNILGNKELSEAVNSQEFQEFLSGLIKENSENLRFIAGVLGNLVGNFKLSKEKEEVLRNELVIAAIVPCEPGKGEIFHPGPIVLDAFFKHPSQLEALKEKIIHLDTRCGYMYHQLEINVSGLKAPEAKRIAEFFTTTRFSAGFDSITIVSDSVLEDCKTIVEFLEMMKKANLKGLSLKGAFGTLPFAQFETMIQFILNVPWVEKLSLASTQLGRLKDEELLTFSKQLHQSTK